MKLMIGIFVIIILWATPIHYIGVTGWKLDNRYIKQTNQDIMYMCPLYTMCHCASLPNETATLLEINCNEVALYKFPGKNFNIPLYILFICIYTFFIIIIIIISHFLVFHIYSFLMLVYNADFHLKIETL